jgi:hypothetical protein
VMGSVVPMVAGIERCPPPCPGQGFACVAKLKVQIEEDKSECLGQKARMNAKVRISLYLRFTVLRVL